LHCDNSQGRDHYLQGGNDKLKYTTCQQCGKPLTKKQIQKKGKFCSLFCNYKGKDHWIKKLLLQQISNTKNIVLDDKTVKAIPLGTKTYPKIFALVDIDNYNLISKYYWHGKNSDCTFYAISRINGKRVRMHRLILGLKHDDRQQGDHINGNGLDNRRCNLRIVTEQQNRFNTRKRKGTSSKYKGVSWHVQTKKWRVNISANGTDYVLGLFCSEKEAALTYDRAAIQFHGEFASLNFPQEINETKKMPLYLRTKSSKYKGVSFDKASGKWQVDFQFNKKRLKVGRFVTEKEAAIAYNETALKHKGPLAKLNNV